MFVGYNVDLTNAELEDYLEIGKNSCQRQKVILKKSLSEYLTDGILDGTKLESDWFPDIKSDIFISYSHNDENLAYSFVGFLKQVFGLNVFIDSNIWGSADELLLMIDKDYAKGDGPHNFSYEKRNFTTSHVHMMLANAIMKVMDNSECIFLLNTEEAIPKISEIEKENYTQSPWLYTEIMLTQMLRKREILDHREKAILEGFTKQANEKLKINYRVNLDNLIKINWEDIKVWRDNYQSKSIPTSPYGLSLDYLYGDTITKD